MNTSGPEPTSARPPVRIPRLFFMISGADPDILRDCPISEQFFIVRIGAHLLFTVTFIFSCLFFGLWTNLAHDSSSKIFVIFLSFSIAMVIFLVDIYIIHASWEEDGQQALETVSRDQRHRFKARRSRLMKLAPRLIISFVVAIVIAVFVDLYIYQKEISRQLIDNAKMATESIEAQIARDLEANFSGQQAAIDKLNIAIEGIQGQSNKAPSVASSITELNGKRDQLFAEKRQLDADLGLANQNAYDAPDEASRQTALRRVRALRNQEAALQAQIKATQGSLDDIRRVTPSADSLTTDRRTNTASRDALVAALKNARDNKEEEIQQRLALRGGAIVPAEGFSARFSALIAYLRGSWSALGLFVLITTLMMFVEISAVVAKIFFAPKTLYAVRAATSYNRALREEAFKPDASDEYEVEKMRMRAEIEHLKSDINAFQQDKL